MNKKEEFLIIFMREILPILLTDVPENQIDEMKAEYYRRISYRYDKFISSPQAAGLSSEELAEKIIIGEKRFLTNMPLLQKQQIYLKDDNLDKLHDLSMSACNMAINFNNSGIRIAEDVSANLLLQMEELTKKVRKHNSGIAAELLSEGSLDLSYALGKTNATSFRLHDNIEWENGLLNDKNKN